MTTHILYIPGLGDGYDRFRERSLSSWRGVSAKLVPSVWYDGGSMDEKMATIEEAINAVPDGERIVLIGESAGATLALHAANRHEEVSKVITLCGVAQRNTPVSSYLRRKAPALDEAVNTLPDSFNKPIDSIRAAADSVVGARYSIANGAKEHRIWSMGHFITIALCLTILSPLIITIAKKA